MMMLANLNEEGWRFVWAEVVNTAENILSTSVNPKLAYKMGMK
jgi:hypothetical protein